MSETAVYKQQTIVKTKDGYLYAGQLFKSLAAATQAIDDDEEEARAFMYQSLQEDS